MPIEICPSGRELGAEILNIDLREELDTETLDVIRQAWREYLVLLIRGQDISDGDLVRFSEYFGELRTSPLGEARMKGRSRSPDGFPQVAIISNVTKDGLPIGSLGNGEAIWHTDMSYLELPIMAAVLYALEVPPSGGDTGFANMYLAHDTLPEELRAELVDRVCIHDHSLNSAGFLRRGYEEVTDVTQTPGARHPLFRTHPETGQQALFLGRRRNAYIPGLPVEESEALLDAVWAHATKPEFTWHHKWNVGDLLMWDNRAVLHRRDSFDNSTRRVMHRTQIEGDKPFYQAA
ncbi:MAG: taurine catabolism dioxygenase TauD [Alphaproteobacteria bacterium]|nr:taurine catabolism dioxygenase TauD [Alphaproteobacteria bacterium]|tara:strand:- start:2068 stop:2943 length:876 start_codon:yes stop_codon:yes gene_type:complete